MKRSKAYRATNVKRIDWAKLVTGHQGHSVLVGIDVGKYELVAVARWEDGRFERPWQVYNPGQIDDFVALLKYLEWGRSLRVALEPSGTYGDPLRQALGDAQVPANRVSPKAAHDYAEVFDGVPSKHDGKDAAVVAELAAIGKSWPWPYVAADPWEQELCYQVDWMDAQRRVQMMWLGRLEALLSRHWPEATRILKLSSATLLEALACYGGPAALAADPAAKVQLSKWGGAFLQPEKVRQLLTSAQATVGVRQGEVDRQRMRQYAQQALLARCQVGQSRRRLVQLAKGHPILQAQGKMLGVPTACVLWVAAGDPRDYFCGAAYRKALGLNLTEWSSGTRKGELHISKRGNAQARRWLYYSALRWVKQLPIKQWYEAKKEKENGRCKGALIAVVRKLVLAAYRVGAGATVFDPWQLFPGAATKPRRGQRGRQSLTDGCQSTTPSCRRRKSARESGQ